MPDRNANRPGYKKTKVGWIPEEWECKQLREIAEINPKKSICADDNTVVTFLAMADVSETGKISSYQTKLLKEVLNGFTYFSEGDILIAKITPCFENGKGAIAKNLESKIGFGSTEFHVVRPKTFDTRLLFFHTRSDLFRKKGEANMTGSAGQKRVPTGFVKHYLLPIPPFSEQKKIAEILSTWDRGIEKLTALIDAKKRLKKALMQQLLTGKIRIRTVDKSNNGWKILKASEIFKTFTKKNCPDEVVLAVTQDQGVVPRDELDRKINMSFDNTHTYKLVEKGDFIISLRSFQGGLEYSDYKGLVSPAYHVIRASKPVESKFYKYYFKSKEFIGRLAVAIIGIRDGKQISYSDFAFMKFPYPPLAEQRKIADVLSTCDKEIQLLEKQLEAFKQQKKGLMQKLLTGEARVTNLLDQEKNHV